EIHSPCRGILDETESTCRYHNFCRPTGSSSRRSRIPDAVPVEVRFFASGDKTVHTCACFIEPEEVTSAFVAARVQHDRYGVITVHRAVTSHGMNGDQARVGVGTLKAEVQLVVLDDRANGGSIRSRHTWTW